MSVLHSDGLPIIYVSHQLRNDKTFILECLKINKWSKRAYGEYYEFPGDKEIDWMYKTRFKLIRSITKVENLNFVFK